MKLVIPTKQASFANPRLILAAAFCLGGVLLALIGLGVGSATSAFAQSGVARSSTVTAGVSYRNDVSPPLRDLALLPVEPLTEHEGPENPKLPNQHKDANDPVVQNMMRAPVSPRISNPLLNFPGIAYPGVGCNCAPPDPTGAVGATQYVQMVNKGVQVFNKSNGTSALGPVSISSLWAGFGGVCETSGAGDPIVLYDHFADRWIISQFAGNGTATDECVAVSTTSDATGSYHRYGFHLGSDFYDYPKLGVWRDAYYMSMNVFNPSGTVFLGPQPFALDRSKMLAGLPATFVSPVGPLGESAAPFLPADVDGPTLPPVGAPGVFVSFPSTGSYIINHFHVDFASPGLSTWTTFASPPAAGFTSLCPTTRACVPQLGATGANSVDGIGDRLMHRAAYRNFGSHEALVGNFSVFAGGVAGIRWFELRGLTTGPVTVHQESTYQPDTSWRWMGSAAMDGAGNLAIGFSASGPNINPQIRYVGRLASDPLGILAQGEKTLHAGTGSQLGTGNRWGDYSSLAIDPVDDATFWYTNQYYETTSSFNWRTRIGSFNLVPENNIIKGGSVIVSAGSNGVLDPGETVTVSLGLQNAGSPSICTTSNLAGTLQATGGATNPNPGWQNYGVICSDGSTVLRNFTFTVDPTLKCGDPLTASLAVTDGAINYGTFTWTFTAGVPTSTFAQNFDGVVAPTLPAGWVATNASGPAPLWVTSNNTPDQPPNTAFIDDPATISDKRLDSPGTTIASTTARLSFRNSYALDAVGSSYYDGGVLEVSSPNINAGAFTDITHPSVGGIFLTGGYGGTISGSFGNPLAGRRAWSGNSGGYINTVVNLGPNVAGQTIKLRFRMGSDSSVASTGWRIDSISITEFACAPGLQSVSSRKTHGSAGSFDVDLPLAGPPGIECRTGGATGEHQIVFHFANPLTSVGHAVSSGVGSVSSSAIGTDAHDYFVNMTGVNNAQTITVSLKNVTDSLGNNSPVVNGTASILLGDTTANGTVNSSDIGQTKSYSGLNTTAGNFRADVTVNGVINSSDIGTIKSESGAALP